MKDKKSSSEVELNIKITTDGLGMSKIQFSSPYLIDALDVAYGLYNKEYWLMPESVPISDNEQYQFTYEQTHEIFANKLPALKDQAMQMLRDEMEDDRYLVPNGFYSVNSAWGVQVPERAERAGVAYELKSNAEVVIEAGQSKYVPTGLAYKSDDMGGMLIVDTKEGKDFDESGICIVNGAQVYTKEQGDNGAEIQVYLENKNDYDVQIVKNSILAEAIIISVVSDIDWSE